MAFNNISVLLVDDHPIVIAGVRQMLETNHRISVVADAQCAGDAMTKLCLNKIDVAIIDISLPDEDGLALLRRIKLTHPHVAVIILSAHGEDLYALRALRLGADGYVTKGASMETLIEAVHKSAAGEKHFSAFLSDLLVRQLQGEHKIGTTCLTPREFDIMVQMVEGASTGTIATALNRSPKTISTHRARIFEKLRVKSNAQLARYAIEHGWISSTVRKTEP